MGRSSQKGEDQTVYEYVDEYGKEDEGRTSSPT
jgi:hypothetical protein